MTPIPLPAGLAVETSLSWSLIMHGAGMQAYLHARQLRATVSYCRRSVQVAKAGVCRATAAAAVLQPPVRCGEALEQQCQSEFNHCKVESDAPSATGSALLLRQSRAVSMMLLRGT